MKKHKKVSKLNLDQNQKRANMWSSIDLLIFSPNVSNMEPFWLKYKFLGCVLQAKNCVDINWMAQEKWAKEYINIRKLLNLG